MVNLSALLSVMGVVRVQEMGVQNAHHVANLIAVKEEDEWVSMGYRSNDIPANGLCDLRNCR